MEELALVRKELRAIGIINQVTKAFHIDKRETSQENQTTQLIALGRKVGIKADAILIIINQLAEKWLPR